MKTIRMKDKIKKILYKHSLCEVDKYGEACDTGELEYAAEELTTYIKENFVPLSEVKVREREAMQELIEVAKKRHYFGEPKRIVDSHNRVARAIVWDMEQYLQERKEDE